MNVHLAMAAAAFRYLPGLRFSLRLVDRPTLRAIRSYSADALLAMLAGRVYFQTDAIVINAFLLPQSKQYNPLRARGAAALGAVVDVIAQQARAFDELRNQLALQIERHGLQPPKAFQKFRFLKP